MYCTITLNLLSNILLAEFRTDRSGPRAITVFNLYYPTV